MDGGRQHRANRMFRDIFSRDSNLIFRLFLPRSFEMPASYIRIYAGERAKPHWQHENSLLNVKRKPREFIMANSSSRFARLAVSTQFIIELAIIK